MTVRHVGFVAELPVIATAAIMVASSVVLILPGRALRALGLGALLRQPAASAKPTSDVEHPNNPGSPDESSPTASGREPADQASDAPSPVAGADESIAAWPTAS